jgi:hypothetical protein
MFDRTVYKYRTWTRRNKIGHRLGHEIPLINVWPMKKDKSNKKVYTDKKMNIILVRLFRISSN